jgi:hypothetical protein
VNNLSVIKSFQKESKGPFVVGALAPKFVVGALAPKFVVGALAPKLVVSALAPKSLVVGALAPKFVVGALAPCVCSRVVIASRNQLVIQKRDFEGH